jgi:hypothetical protein
VRHAAAKALNQWGGAASPLIQRFRHVRRGEEVPDSDPLKNDPIKFTYVNGSIARSDFAFGRPVRLFKSDPLLSFTEKRPPHLNGGPDDEMKVSSELVVQSYPNYM